MGEEGIERLRDVGTPEEMYYVRPEAPPHLQRLVLHRVPRGHTAQPGCEERPPASLGSSTMALPCRLGLVIGDTVT